MRNRLSSSSGVGKSGHSPSLSTDTMRSMASAVALLTEDAGKEEGEGGGESMFKNWET